jgi:hypothetical protein
LPGSLIRNLRGGQVDRIYTFLKERSLDEKEILIDTPEGKIRLLVPQSSNFGENDHEPALVRKIFEISDKDTVFFDIGAQYGFHSLVAESAGCENIHCFEADSLIYSILEKNVNAETNHGFVGTCEEEDICIDSYCTDTVNPDIVKIDVEGAELKVLKGMRKTLEEAAPELLIEVHPKMMREFGSSPEELKDYIEGCGYSIQSFDHRENEVSEIDFEKGCNIGNFAVHCRAD